MTPRAESGKDRSTRLKKDFLSMYNDPSELDNPLRVAIALNEAMNTALYFNWKISYIFWVNLAAPYINEGNVEEQLLKQVDALITEGDALDIMQEFAGWLREKVYRK